jgi:hypothetical protein
MAKVLGEAGRYVSQEARRKGKQILLLLFVTIGVNSSGSTVGSTNPICWSKNKATLSSLA